jgi:hypothetical protein
MPTTKDEQPATVEVEEMSNPASCGILGRYPVLSVLIFAAVGLGVGVGLSFWEDDGDSKDKTLKWIGLIGDLFIRSLKCVILPLVFINVVISVMDMMTIGKAGSIGWKTVVPSRVFSKKANSRTPLRQLSPSVVTEMDPSSPK